MRRFSFYVKRFLAWAEKCRSPITVAVYRHYADRFIREVGDKTVSRLTVATLSEWACTWHQSQALIRIFRWCVDDARLLKRNPFEGAQHPPKGERKRTLTRREILRLVRNAKPDFRRLLIAFRESWARPGEIRRAKWTHLSPRPGSDGFKKALVTGRAKIVLHDYKNRKSRRLPNAPRVILISPRLGRLIARLWNSAADLEGTIFRTRDNVAWTANALRCRVRRLRARLGFTADERGENIVPYTFRHTGATEAAAAGIRDRILADVLGHTETATTARYQHLQTHHLRKALRRYWNRRKRR